MGKHVLGRHRHQWSEWAVVMRTSALGNEWPVRYDDGTVLWEKHCEVQDCTKQKHRCWRPDTSGHGRRKAGSRD